MKSHEVTKMPSHDFYYNHFLKSIIILKKLHLYDVRGIKGMLYRYYSQLAYNKYIPLTLTEIKQLKSGDNDYIISLTTYGNRINTVHITIDSLLTQELKPAKIILWLAKDEFPNGYSDLPDELIKRVENIEWFNISFCDDLKPHKKYYECMRNYSNKVIVTCDDDVFYPSDWLMELNKLHQEHPECICCTNAHTITLNELGNIQPYSSWIHLTDEQGPSLTLCPIGVGGVMYPPHTLDNRVFDKAFIIQNCINADDLWLKAMSLLERTKVVKTNKFWYTFLNIPQSSENALSIQNVLQNRNDEQLENILKRYGDALLGILNS